MINNSRALIGMVVAAVWAAGCGDAQARPPEPFQGIVELEERVLGFELGGRLASVEAQAGAQVETGARLAALDDTMERLARQAREAERRAAIAQLALLQEGARPEEIRAARAELGAARAGEALLQRNLDRQRRLATQGAGTELAVDTLAGQVEQATAQRQALDQRLRAIRGGARSQEVEAAEARVEALDVALAASDERLARHILVSSLSATVLDVHAEAGEVVGPGTPVVTLADATRPYVDVYVPQGDIRLVHIGARAAIRIDADREPLHGRVENVARRTEFTPRFLFSERERPNLVVRVRIRVEDPDRRLYAGLPAFVTLDRQAGGEER